MIKGLWCDTRFTSVQPPDQYADRWLQRFMALFSAPRCAGCRAARHDLLVSGPQAGVCQLPDQLDLAATLCIWALDAAPSNCADPRCCLGPDGC